MLAASMLEVNRETPVPKNKYHDGGNGYTGVHLAMPPLP